MDILRLLTETIAGILFQAVLYFKSLTGSSGLAIIVLTLAIRVILFPLTRRQLESVRKVRSLAPAVAALRERLTDDPRQFRSELASLYREHRIRPSAGLLLMLIQTPVLMGLWSLFRRRNVFAGERFLGVPLDATPNLPAILQNPAWLFVPLLVAAATFWQQQANAVDTNQLIPFLIIAAVAGYFAMQVSVGMSVYWFTSSLASVVETYLANQWGNREPAPTIHPRRPRRSKRENRD